MLAVHLRPGPKGYAVITEDNIILADHLTYWRALRMVREGQDLDPKFTGNRSFPSNPGGRRVPRRNHSHNQAQSPNDFFTP